MVDILGTHISELSETVFKEEFLRAVDRAGSGNVQFSYVNIHVMNQISRSKSLQKAINQMDTVYCDGQGVSLASLILHGRRLPRFTSLDYIEDLLSSLEKRRAKLFLLGGTSEVLSAAVAQMSERFPHLEIVGASDGYFTDDSEVLEAIKEAKPQVIINGMGTPRQELFSSRLCQDDFLGAVILNVGGMLDYWSGHKKRSSFLWRALGHEWLGRLIREPQRYWKRYLIGNPLFILRIIRSKCKGISIKWYYGLKRRYLVFFRYQKIVTKILGKKHKVSLNRIEVDITYRCDLLCQSCSRVVREAPAAMDMSLEMIEAWVSDSKKKKIPWQRIVIMGGEPTLHPQFQEVLRLFYDYKRTRGEDFELILATNGQNYFEASSWPLLKVICDRADSARKQQFVPILKAPVDEYGNRLIDYSNGCSVLSESGMCLNERGFYPCPVAAAIDRVYNLGLSAKSAKMDEYWIRHVLQQCCRYCGNFVYGGVRPPEAVSMEESSFKSSSWMEALEKYKDL